MATDKAFDVQILQTIFKYRLTDQCPKNGMSVVGQVTAISEILPSKKPPWTYLIQLRSLENPAANPVVIFVTTNEGDDSWRNTLEFSNYVFTGLTITDFSLATHENPQLSSATLRSSKCSRCYRFDPETTNRISYIEWFEKNAARYKKLKICSDVTPPSCEPDKDAAMLMNYRGVVTKVEDKEYGIYQLDKKYCLYLTFLSTAARIPELILNETVTLMNVHIWGRNLMCCGLTSVKVTERQPDHRKYLNGIGGFIYERQLQLHQVRWLKKTVNGIQERLAPNHRLPLSLRQLRRLFPYEVFGQTDRLGPLELRSVQHHFFSHPHSCIASSKLKSSEHRVEYVSCDTLKRIAMSCLHDSNLEDIGKWTWNLGICDSTSLGSPRKVLVAVLTCSTKDGSIELRDTTGVLQCTVADSAILPINKLDRQINSLLPHYLNSVVILTNFNLVAERFAPVENEKDAVTMVYIEMDRRELVTVHSVHPVLQASSLGGANRNSASLPLPSNGSAARPLPQDAPASLLPPRHDPPPKKKSRYIFFCRRKMSLVINSVLKEFSFKLEALLLSDWFQRKENTDGHATPVSVSIWKLLHFCGSSIQFFNVCHENYFYEIILNESALADSGIPMLGNDSLTTPKIIIIRDVTALEWLPPDEYQSLWTENASYLKDDIHLKQYSISDILKNKSEMEMIEVYGIVGDRTYDFSPRSLSNLDVNVADCIFKKFRVGLPNGLKMMIVLPESSDEKAEKVRCFVDLSIVAYPLSVRQGARVRITAVNVVKSQQGGIYLKTTSWSRIEIITLAPINSHQTGIPTDMSSGPISLLLAYKESPRVLLAHALARFKDGVISKYLGMVQVQQVIEFEAKLVCPACKKLVQGPRCMFAGCHTQSPPLDCSRLRISVSDGTQRAVVTCNGPTVRQILLLSENVWTNILTSTRCTGRGTYNFSKGVATAKHLPGSKTLFRLLTRPAVVRTVLMRIQSRPSPNAHGQFVCTALEELTSLEAISCFPVAETEKTAG